MSEYIDRRRFLTRLWQAGTGLLAGVAAWTTWDVMRPLATTGFGGSGAVRPTRRRRR